MTLAKLPQYQGIPIDEIWHFKKEGFEFLKDSALLFEQADSIFCGLEGRASQQKATLIQAIEDNDKAALDDIGQSIGHNIQVLNRHRWQTQTKAALAKSSLWDTMREKVDAVEAKKLYSLEQEWQASMDFATYSSEAMAYLAHRLIPQVADFFEGAKEAFIEKRHRLKDKPCRDAICFLRGLSTWIDTVQAALLQAMIKRLIQVSLHGDIHFDDVCYDMAQKLKAMHVLDETYRLGTPSRGLSAACFDDFHDHIWRYASDKQKREFKAHVSWLAPDSDHHITTYRGRVLIQPKCFDELVGSNIFMRAFDWLFGVTTPKMYLLQHRHLIAKSRLSMKHSVVLSDAKYLDGRLRAAEALCEGIENTLTNNPIPQGLWRYLQPRTYHKITHYRAYWHTHINHLQHQCLAILTKDIERLKGEAFSTKVSRYRINHWRDAGR